MRLVAANDCSSTRSSDSGTEIAHDVNYLTSPLASHALISQKTRRFSCLRIRMNNRRDSLAGNLLMSHSRD